MVKTWTTLGAIVLVVGLAGCGTTGNTASSSTNASTNNTASTSSGATSTSSKWMSYDASTKTANLTLEAGSGGGFDFNGYTKGAMTVTVPNGWTVDVSFTDEVSVPHSAMIVPFSQVHSGENFTPAFSGAQTSNPTTGSAKGATESFTFTANKVGKYGIVCAVPGHDDAGMWDTFVVSGSASTPSVTTK